MQRSQIGSAQKHLLHQNHHILNLIVKISNILIIFASPKLQTMKTNVLLYHTDIPIDEEIKSFAESFTDKKLQVTTVTSCVELKSNCNTYTDTILLLNTSNHQHELLQFLKETKLHLTKIIVVSNNKNHVFDFVQYHIFDFLTLPAKTTRILATLNRAIVKFQEENKIIQTKVTQSKFQKFITLNSTKKIELIKLDDIICFEADGRYTAIYLKNGGSKMASKNLGEFQRLLDPDCFCRIHHKYIINMNNLVNIIKSDGCYCEMNNNKIIPVSKRKLEDFNALLHKGKIQM